MNFMDGLASSFLLSYSWSELTVIQEAQSPEGALSVLLQLNDSRLASFVQQDVEFYTSGGVS